LRIDLKVNPLVLELTGKKTPHEGLEGKFSICHAVAVAMVEGKAGEKQFGDQAVQDPTIIALRDKVLPVVDTAIKPEQVDMSVILKDGPKLHKYIEHTTGSREAPMTDADLETKFVGLVEGILAAEEIQELICLCWGVEKLSKAAAIAKSAIPRRNQQN
jgi:2-methylcitrate dehydratase PrpD